MWLSWQRGHRFDWTVMDPFLRYLIVVNVVTFLAFAVDYLLCARYPRLQYHAANSLVLDLFPIAGGAAGMLLALFLLAGRGRAHRMNKDNIAWWFLAMVCLVAWALVCLVRFGFVTIDAGVAGVASGWDAGRLRVLGVYLVVINVVTFGVYAWDKRVSATGNDYRRRAPEARLLGLGILGGAVGGLIAVHALRHKTRKWYFVWGLPCFIALDVAVILYAHMCGLI